MRVVILGAAGKIGQLTAQRAVTAGHEVTAVARAVARLVGQPWATSPHARLVDADLLDPDAVSAAVAGQHAVICTFGAPLTLANVLRPPSLCADVTAGAVRAMRRHGVRRLICVSAIGVGDSRGRGRLAFRRVIQPLLLNRIFRDREAQERLIAETDLDWTIVRPAELTDAPATGTYRALTELAGQSITTVSRGDVADFLVRQLESDAFLRQTPLLTR
jgi:putative NADH-flavin reductase